VTRRAYASQLAVLLVASAAAMLAEAVVVAARVWQQGALEVFSSVHYTVGLWFWPCLLVGAALAWLLASLLGDDTFGLALREQWSSTERRRLVQVMLLLAAPFVALVFALARAFRAFHNVELAAALLAGLVLASLVLLVSFGWVLVRRLRRAADMRWLGPVALVMDAVVLLWLVWETRSGLAQLDGYLVAAPLAFVAAFTLADRSEWVRTLGKRAAVAAAILGLLCGVVLLVPGQEAHRVLRRGAWSPLLLRALQQLSDFDRDGYSSFLGGGDCAAFDSAVHPAAPERAGDGIDNNCIDGDAGKAWQPRRPSWGAQAHGAPVNLNVVVVTIETLRRDHASFVKYRRDTTPELRALARDALVFERMYSAAPLTRLALASLFSSYAPSEIEWLPLPREKRMRRIGPRTPWLPELLRARGYETVAVLTDFAAFTAQEDAGFERGFQHYDLSTRLQYRGGTMWGFPATEQVDKAIAYVERSKRPFMLWLHLFEPHYSYEQPPGAPTFGDDEQSRYDAEIWHVDQQVGRLVKELRRLGVWDDTLLFVSGDHGEAFGEHQDRWHGSNLHDPQLRPAALLRVPGVSGKRISDAVTFTDIAPTIARVLGDRQIFEQMRGRSLTPFLHRKPLPAGSNGFIAESFSVDDGRAYQAAFIDYPLKLIYVEEGRRFSLFDLERDPAEQRPIEPGADPRAAPLWQALVGYLERSRPNVSPRSR
jgi:arylsulfatase A-like enzyme